MTTNKPTPIVRAPLFPLYSELSHAIRLFDGEPVKTVLGTIKAIQEQTGTPKNPVDWSQPDEWISTRLTGDYAAFARKIWEGSGKTLNPRHIYGCYLFINRQELLGRKDGVYKANERSKKFLASDSKLLHELDANEGIDKLLSMIAERSPCSRADILPEWGEYLALVSRFSAPISISETLRHRINNVAERGLISREGNSYLITNDGIAWLRGFKNLFSTKSESVQFSKRTAVAEAARANNEEQLDALRARLMKLEPEKFEHFVKALLDAMEYQDVRVTRYSGDMGVDVIAKVQFGITEITEVVQVKRTQSNIGRPKVDELRGALPYHKAIRGTIISLGSFTRDAKEGALFVGAAPITLIDGKRLLELCAKHEVGLQRRPVDIYEVNEGFFSANFDEIEQAEETELEAL